MARLAAFISTDRERKLKKSQEQMPPPTRSSDDQSPNPTTPSASSTPQSTWSQQSSHSSHTDLQLTPNSTSQAYEEWERLRADFRSWKHAFNVLRQIRVEQNMPTPFGPAIIYTDIRVAAAEMLYLAARIHLSRAHPEIPALVPAAIGATAAQNGPSVAEIMRIQEGLWDSKNFRPVDGKEDGRSVGGDGSAVDHVVSALSNCAWPMVVGGNQVRDEKQRKWMKKRLCDIYELSGFATAVLLPVFAEINGRYE
jgi:hypothetical protein